MAAPDAFSMSRRFAEALGHAPISALITNLQTGLQLLETPRGPLPMTANAAKDGPTCYICCPSVAYADYAAEELRNFRAMPALHRLLEGLIGLSRPLVRGMGLDQQVQPNNWLFSTNIWCGFSLAELQAITTELLALFPDRAILWRSLNDYGDAAALDTFRQAGYRLFPARQIYLYDCRNDLPPLRRDVKNDLKVLERGGLDHIGPEAIRPEHYARIADLYGQLYLQKYTALNPQYQPEFIRAMHETGIVELHGFCDKVGEMQAVIGFFCQGEVMTAPIIGYEMALQPTLSLYRQLVVFGMLEARKRRMLYNMSAGASTFKRSRGALPAIEYSAAYNRHLPHRARLAGRVVEGLLSGLGVPLMKRFEL